ncbi:MAG: YbhB/YbcL family Raf kinase inhibitor-like protein [Myxococcota bacterium]
MRILPFGGFVALTLLVGCGDDSSGDTGAGSTSTTDAVTSSSGGAAESSTGSAEGESTAADSTGSADSSGGTDSTGEGAESSSGVMVDFGMSSPAFEPDGPFPGTMHVAGGNMSPQLDWEGAPADTQSFGIFFHDETISFNHSAIWNIPGDAEGVPGNIELEAMPASVAGAVQCQSWIDEFGYGGPGSPANFYVFTLYALDIDDLSGEIDQNSSLGQVRTALENHAIESVTLRGQSAGPG